MNFANDITDLIGNTPLIKLNAISEETGNLVLGKCEFLNPTHSVKDRLAYSIITDSFNKKLIDKTSTIIEPTSGNTGIGLAAICATYKLKLILTMPSSMSIERRKLLKALGAKLVLTDPSLGMKGAVNKAVELQQEIKGGFIPQQFENQANVDFHKKTTAIEILRDTEDKIDIFVAAIGTGGTLTGVGEVLKEKNNNIQVVLVEPTDSPLLSTGTPGAHKIQGIGPNFVPKILNKDVFDDIFTVEFDDCIIESRKIAKQEGLLVGISAGANIYAAKKIAEKYQGQNKTIVTILCDTGERYLSTSLYQFDED